ncbi:MAG TPA: ABC transporter permease [Coriobacteriia bacterium]
MSIIWSSMQEAGRLLANGDPVVWQIITLSLRVSSVATAIGMLIGLPLGYVLGTTVFAGRRVIALLVILLVNTGMGLPPVVVGLFVTLALSRSGPLGFMGWLFTPQAMVLAQVIIATPLIAGVSAAAVGAVPEELRLQARSLGAGRLAEGLLTLNEARGGVLSAIVAGFGGVISEIGAVMMVGGNIEGYTRVMTTAIVTETRMGNTGNAIALAFILLGLALAVNGLLTWLQHMGAAYER